MTASPLTQTLEVGLDAMADSLDQARLILLDAELNEAERYSMLQRHLAQLGAQLKFTTKTLVIR